MWAVLISRSARLRPIIERSQRSIVENRSPKVVMKARCTKNHTNHPLKPLRRTLCTLAMARNRPIVATLPMSRYLNGTAVLALQPSPDRVGGVQSALHGHFGDARKLVQRRHVTHDEDLGMTGQAEVGEHRDAAGAVELGTAGRGQLGREG